MKNANSSCWLISSFIFLQMAPTSDPTLLKLNDRDSLVSVPDLFNDEPCYQPEGSQMYHDELSAEEHASGMATPPFPFDDEAFLTDFDLPFGFLESLAQQDTEEILQQVTEDFLHEPSPMPETREPMSPDFVKPPKISPPPRKRKQSLVSREENINHGLETHLYEMDERNPELLPEMRRKIKKAKKSKKYHDQRNDQIRYFQIKTEVFQDLLIKAGHTVEFLNSHFQAIYELRSDSSD